MTEVRPPQDAETPERNDEAEFSIARSNALIPLLLMFAVTVLAIVAVIVRAKPVIPPEGAVANKAFGPADFPIVFAQGRGAHLVPAGGGAGASAMIFPVPAPPFSEGIFPCT